MRVTICDDETVFLRKLKRQISYFKIPDIEIRDFTSGRVLLSSFGKSFYEIIILDVEMPEMDGIEVAKRIRAVDKDVILSFLTNYAEFAVKGYEVSAFRYILKDQPEYLRLEQLKSIFEECEQRFKYFKFNNKSNSFFNRGVS